MFLFYLSVLIAAAALNAVMLATPLFLIKTFNVGPIFLGLLGTVGAICYTFSVFMAGKLADRFQKRLLISAGCICFAIIYFLVPYVKNPYHVLILVPLGSISMSFFWPSVQSWLAQGLDKKALVKALGVFNISWSVGMMIGPFISGILFEKSKALPFISASVAVVFVIVMMNIKLSEKKAHKSDLPDGMPASIECHDKSMLRKFLYIGWIANFSSWFCIGIIRVLFPKLTTSLGISPAALGLIMFAMGLSQMAVFVISGAIHKWHYNMGLLVIVQFLGLVGLGMIYFANSVLFFGLAIFICGICFGMTYYSSIFYSLWGYVDKGSKSGIHESIIGAGSLVGPLLGGLAAQFFSLRAPYLISIVAISAAIAVEVYILKRNDRCK